MNRTQSASVRRHKRRPVVAPAGVAPSPEAAKPRSCIVIGQHRVNDVKHISRICVSICRTFRFCQRQIAARGHILTRNIVNVGIFC
jgi:hypothetical protein